MEELLIPNASQHDVASYNILVDDVELNASYQVMGISVIKEINRIPFAKIIIRDGDAASRNFEISSSDNVVPGKKIKIKIGLDGENQQVFAGIITKHSVKVRENGNTELIIECRDETVKMALGRHSKYFENIKDSAVFEEIISKYGLQSDAEASTLQHKELVQHSITDWDFILLRAEACGMLVNVSDGEVKISKPDTSPEPVLQITYGSSIIEFEAEMDARSQWKNIEAVSWDYANQALFKADTSEAAGFSQPGNIPGSELAETVNLEKFLLQHSGHLLEQELQDWVDGVMIRSRLAKIRGRASITGFSGVKPGDIVKVEGIGDRFNGNVYVTAVKQELSDSSWYTQIQFGLDPKRYAASHEDANDFTSSGLISSIHGLQIGKAVRLSSDPDGEDRILVKIPVIDNNAEGTWVRVACPDAGSDRGVFFRPEIGDEVIVGFINGDPRHGVMLGMLHSSAKAAPLKAEDANHEKGIFTRSKMRVHFNDDTKTITMDTPAGNSIMLDEQGTKIEVVDQNSNKITMDTSGIKMESPKNIEIKAGVDLKLTAGASLSIGGVTISVKADGSLELSGATSKLSASGITEVSGSLVKIN